MAKSDILIPKYNLFFLISSFIVISLSFSVLFFPQWFIPLIWSKTLLFRTIVSFLLVIFLALILLQKKYLFYVSQKIKVIILPLFLLLLLWFTCFLSTLSSLDMNFSLWGDPLRAGGFVSYSFYIIFGFLAYLVFKEKDWVKVWSFSFFSGVIVSLIAILQRFGIWKSFLTPVYFQPPSTIGNPILVANYLLLLFFICLIFILKSKNIYKKAAYILSALLFIFVIIFITETRANFLALAVGISFFLFFYFRDKRSKMLLVFLIAFLLLSFFAIKFLDDNYNIFESQPLVIKAPIRRMFTLADGSNIAGSRISVWEVSLEAFKSKPFLGYGPENFEIGFNKYYDPSLSEIANPREGTLKIVQWWDRAHNFMLDMLVSTGIFSLLAYLFLIGIIFWRLNAVKKVSEEARLSSIGIQSAIVGYFTAVFFSFDCYDTYLIFFLIIGYSFYLLSLNKAFLSYGQLSIGDENMNKKNIITFLKIFLLLIVFSLFVLFIVFFNIIPLMANEKLNDFLGEKQKTYDEYLKKSAEISKKHSIIDNYVRINLAEAIVEYDSDNVQLKSVAFRDSINFLQENIKLNPNHLREWLLAGEMTNTLIRIKDASSNGFLDAKEAQILENEADYYFRQASYLSPERPEIYKEWAKTGLASHDYILAEEKSLKCINLNESYGTCSWTLALVNIYKKDEEKFNYYLKLAEDNKYPVDSEESLTQIIDTYQNVDEYKKVVEYCLKAIPSSTDDARESNLLYILADAYKKLNDREKARQAALQAFKLWPDSKIRLDGFLKDL
jgi:O-antigen ligase